MSLSDNSSGYEQTLHENNLKLTELQLYINKIERCICIVDFYLKGDKITSSTLQSRVLLSAALNKVVVAKHKCERPMQIVRLD